LLLPLLGSTNRISKATITAIAVPVKNSWRIQLASSIKGGDKLQYFAIAGTDKKYVWANAAIENNHVVVWNDDVDNPVAVRYAWADNPEGANLYNKEGLPASPFRTDK